MLFSVNCFYFCSAIFLINVKSFLFSSPVNTVSEYITSYRLDYITCVILRENINIKSAFPFTYACHINLLTVMYNIIGIIICLLYNHECNNILKIFLYARKLTI